MSWHNRSRIVCGFALAAWVWAKSSVTPAEIEWRKNLDTGFLDSVESLGPAEPGCTILWGAAGPVPPPEGEVIDFLSPPPPVLLKVSHFDGTLIWRSVLTLDPVWLECRSNMVRKARATRDGGYIAVGESNVWTIPDGCCEILVVRTGGNGSVLWYKRILGPQYKRNQRALDVLERQEGGFVVLGERLLEPPAMKEVLLIAIDDDYYSGGVLWERVYGRDGRDECFAMAETRMGYVVVGTHSVPGPDQQRAFVLHVDRRGDVLWEKTLSPPIFEARAVATGPDGSILVAGSARLDEDRKFVAWVAKLDAEGEVVWSTLVGQGPDRFEDAFALAVAPDGGAVLAGTSSSLNASVTNEYVARVSPAGEVHWGLSLGESSRGWGVQLLADGGYLVSGMGDGAEPGIYLAKMAAEDLPGYRFVRGDANRDGGVNVADAVFLLRSLFLGGGEVPCPDAGDANDDAQLNLSDAVYLLDHLFRGGPALPPPFPHVGVDVTLDGLPCVEGE